MAAASQGQPKRGMDSETEEQTTQDAYFFTEEDGLRHVRPNVFGFRSNAKGRWWGRQLVEVFAKELVAYPKEYYHYALVHGRITVNGEMVGPEYVIRGGDVIVHYTHRHEPPVRGTKNIEVVANTEEFLVVNKPSTVPIHPCGNYRLNSLSHILEDERFGVDGVESLHIVHRLDRLTSGLCIFSKSPSGANKFGKDLRARNTRKVYLARVVGDFGKMDFDSRWKRPTLASPDGVGWSIETAVTLPPMSDYELDQSAGLPCPSVVRVQQPIACESRRGGVHKCFVDDPSVTTFTPPETPRNADGPKEAATLFRCVSFNGETSLVECWPLHGRTHQLRLHLQFLGYPIANDPNYGGQVNYGDEAGGIAHEDPNLAARRDGVEITAAYQAPQETTGAWYQEARSTDETLEQYITRTCCWCQAGRSSVGLTASGTAGGEPGDLSDQGLMQASNAASVADKVYSSGIWLHAFKYARKDPDDPKGDWEFQTSLPVWAKPGFLEHNHGANKAS